MTDPRSPFNWQQNRRPSIMWTKAGEDAAKRLQQVAGKSMDSQGRAVVDLKPKTKNALTIGKSFEDQCKTAKIVGKRNGARSQ